MVKKKTNTNLYQPQGMTTGQSFQMPESALINTQAQNAGLSSTTSLSDGKLNVVNVTPTSTSNGDASVSPKLYKGVDISGSFKQSDFANPDDYEQAKRRAGSFATGGAYAQDIQQQEAEQQMMQQKQVLQELGAVGNITQTELNGLIEQYGLSGKQQFKEGLPGAMREAIPSALQSGATAGLGMAVAGSVGAGAGMGALGGPVGIAIGASAGVVFGLWKGLRAAKKSEAAEDVKNAMSEFTQMKTGLTQVATLASAGYINASEAVELYNAHLTRMLQIEAQIKYLQDTNLKDYLSDGSDDLAQVQSYLKNVAPVYAMRIRSALMNPQSKVPYSDITIQDMTEQQND